MRLVLEGERGRESGVGMRLGGAYLSAVQGGDGIVADIEVLQ